MIGIDHERDYESLEDPRSRGVSESIRNRSRRRVFEPTVRRRTVRIGSSFPFVPGIGAPITGSGLIAVMALIS